MSSSESSASLAQSSSPSVGAESEAEAELESNSGAELELSAESNCQSDAGSEAQAEDILKLGEDSEPSAESGALSEAEEAEVESNFGVESEASAEPSLQGEAEANKEADSQADFRSTAGSDSKRRCRDAGPDSSDAASDEDSDESDEDSAMDTSWDEDPDSTAMDASSHPKKIRKDTAKPERFDANTFGTLQEHVASHNFPKHVATCGPCHFWKNRARWSVEFCCFNPVSQKMETWLACKNGFALCLICSAMDKSRTSFGRGLGSCLRKLPMQRHAKCAEHKSAVQAWQQRLLAEASGIDIVSNSTVALTTSASATVASDMAASATAAAVSDRTLRPTHGYRALVAVRALLETAGSFRSLDVWLDALLGEDRQALNPDGIASDW